LTTNLCWMAFATKIIATRRLQLHVKPF